MAFNPLVIHICGVYEVAAMAFVGIHNEVAFSLSGISSKDIAA
jgi:hypothetical protein